MFKTRLVRSILPQRTVLQTCYSRNCFLSWTYSTVIDLMLCSTFWQICQGSSFWLETEVFGNIESLCKLCLFCINEQLAFTWMDSIFPLHFRSRHLFPQNWFGLFGLLLNVRLLESSAKIIWERLHLVEISFEIAVLFHSLTRAVKKGSDL